MKIYVSKRQVQKTDTFSTLSPLHCVLKFFGLSCIYRNDSDLKYFSTIWRVSIFSLLFLIATIYCLYNKLRNDNGEIRFNFSDTVQMTFSLGYIQYVTDATFNYKYGREDFINYILHYDYIDGLLGVSYNDVIKRNVRNMCVFFIVLGRSTIIDYYTWIESFNWYVIGIYSLEYIYLAIRMLAALDAVTNAIHMKYRLKALAELLENSYSNYDNASDALKDFVYAGKWISSDDVVKISYVDTVKGISYNDQNFLLRLHRCYILLTEQCEFLNTRYGFRILVASVIYLLDMVIMLNLVIRLLLGTLMMPFNSNAGLVVVSTAVRIAIYSLNLIYGICCCEQNYRQVARIMSFIDHLLVAKKITQEIREGLKDLKDIIISKPINIHAMNFYRLDYGMLASMASAMVTYTIIFLQSVQ